jgi:flagellar protein FlgJ
MNTITTDITYDPVVMGTTGSRLERANRVAEEFESLFLSQLMNEMDATVEREDEDMLYGGAEDTYRGLFNQELAREMARGEGVGLKQLVAYQLQQESPDVAQQISERR